MKALCAWHVLPAPEVERAAGLRPWGLTARSVHPAHVRHWRMIVPDPRFATVSAVDVTIVTVTVGQESALQADPVLLVHVVTLAAMFNTESRHSAHQQLTLITISYHHN